MNFFYTLLIRIGMYFGVVKIVKREVPNRPNYSPDVLRGEYRGIPTSECLTATVAASGFWTCTCTSGTLEISGNDNRI